MEPFWNPAVEVRSLLLHGMITDIVVTESSNRSYSPTRANDASTNDPIRDSEIDRRTNARDSKAKDGSRATELGADADEGGGHEASIGRVARVVRC